MCLCCRSNTYTLIVRNFTEKQKNMPELISKYKIFLASPSDLSEERESINQVIDELNLTFGNQNNLVLELQK